MSTNESEIYKKFYGPKICTENLNIEGVKTQIPCDIYDGYAVCLDHKGHRYDLVFPQVSAIKESTELMNAVIDYVGGITNKEEITAIHSLITFSSVYKDGKEIKPKN